MTGQPDPYVKLAYYRERALAATTLSESLVIVRLYRIWERIVEEMKPEDRT